MHSVVYVLLISLGAYLLLGIFHFIIYLQQNDKAFRNYALYLFMMCGFNVLRLLDARLTDFYPLSYETVATLDPVFSNLAFLMYANFLSQLQQIRKHEKALFYFWKFLQIFIPAFLLLFLLIRITGGSETLSGIIISIASLICMSGGLVMTLYLLRKRRDIFFKLVIAGTLIVVAGVLTGFLVNLILYNDGLAFQGIYIMEICQMVEASFLSAALGYRLKLAFVEKEKAQQVLLEETRKREALAVETARLLQQELDVKELQSRISRDLHDDIGASLSGLQIYSELAVKMVDSKPQEVRKLLQRIAADASNIIEHIGHIVWAIQPADSPAQSLETRIRAITYDLLSPRGIYARVELDEEACIRCNQPELRRALVLMIKESVNNAAKYSEATTVTVRLRKEEGMLLLTVEDDGIGFDGNLQRVGNGLVNIRTRAAKLGGSARIISAPGNGTRMECRIPLPIFSDNAHGIKS